MDAAPERLQRLPEREHPADRARADHRALAASMVFKVVLQLVFALVPVLTYLLSRRFLPTPAGAGRGGVHDGLPDLLHRHALPGAAGGRVLLPRPAAAGGDRAGQPVRRTAAGSSGSSVSASCSPTTRRPTCCCSGSSSASSCCGVGPPAAVRGIGDDAGVAVLLSPVVVASRRRQPAVGGPGHAHRRTCRGRRPRPIAAISAGRDIFRVLRRVLPAVLAATTSRPRAARPLRRRHPRGPQAGPATVLVVKHPGPEELKPEIVPAARSLPPVGRPGRRHHRPTRDDPRSLGPPPCCAVPACSASPGWSAVRGRRGGGCTSKPR